MVMSLCVILYQHMYRSAKLPHTVLEKKSQNRERKKKQYSNNRSIITLNPGIKKKEYHLTYFDKQPLFSSTHFINMAYHCYEMAMV